VSVLGYILTSARYYGRAHLGLLFGAFIASAILSGSLLVGDSVKASLKRVAELRLGKVQSGMIGGDRWFTEKLAQDAKTTPMVLAIGSASATTGKARVNAVQVLGIDDTFWKLGPSGKAITLKSSELAVNTSLASKLGVKVGDAIIVRMEKPSALSRDAPLSGSTNSDVALRRTIAAIVSADDFGSFQLAASQITPDSAFLPLEDLQGQIEQEGKVNAMLADSRLEVPASRLEEFALKLKQVQGTKKEWELSTDRVFVDDSLADKLLPSLPEGHGVLTYLVNGISSATGKTPYSMVTATHHSSLTSKDSALITQWLAEDHNLKVGDAFEIRYFIVSIGRELKEQTAKFTVAGIVPMTDPMVTKAWTPDFPGVSDVDNCADWDPGFPMDNKAIRDKDEKYWDDYRGTPKVFISLEAGQKLWGNRFGKLTALRFADSGQQEAALRTEITSKLKLADIGLVVQDFQGQASAAAKGSVDFGGLFIGLSLFLIAAALVFAALLFLFMIERRAPQVGLLMALGWTPKLVRKTLLLEAGVIAFLGSVLGLFGGVFYTKTALAGLNGDWSGATVGLQLVFAAQPVTLIIALVSSFVVSMLTLWWTTRKLFLTSPTALMSGGDWLGRAVPSAPRRSAQTCKAATDSVGSNAPATALGGPSVLPQRAPWLSLWVIVPLLGAITLSIAGSKATNAEALAGMFFGAGTLLMIAAMSFAKGWMRAQSNSHSLARSVWQIGVRNVVRRPGRSLAVLGMMAGGLFLVAAVNAFRISAGDPAERQSGTGGFALIGESSLPVYEDLDSKAGRDAFSLDDEDMKDVSVLPFRVRPGDDASCLNLNRAQNPQLTGVSFASLAKRNAFTFASGSWEALNAESSEVLAVADQATAMWGLGKGVGDVIEYDVGSKKLRVKIAALLVGSVLQGKIIIDEKDFIDALPDVAGYRFFLIDAPTARDEDVSSTLTQQLEQRGLALESTATRLNAFNAVQNTYIGIFTVLGGLGVLLGTAGIGVLVARHVLERKGELGLMQAVGFTPGALRNMVIGEHSALLLGGVVLGVLSAALAVWPNLQQSAQGLPIGFLVKLIVGITAFGLAVCAVSAAMALRGRLVDAVRKE